MKKYNANKPSDMKRLANDIENRAKKIAEQKIKSSTTVYYFICPHCRKSISLSLGKGKCPYCHNDVKLKTNITWK